MKVINFSEHNTVINNYLAELRDIDVQKNRAWFRQNLRRIGHAMAFEVSKTLDYSKKMVQTPLAEAEVNTTDDRIVIGTVLRAGLALHEGFLDVFSDADSAFVSAYRKEGRKDDIEICVEYIASPNLDGSTFMLVDPMLATGGSATAAIELLRARGAKNIRMINLVAAPEDIAAVHEKYPEVNIYVASVDEKLNDHKYIVPGLGDAGDRLFGTK